MHLILQGLPGPSGVPGMPGLKGYKVCLLTNLKFYWSEINQL